MTPPRTVSHLRDIVGDVDVILSDIWGVVHNGVESFAAPCEALATFRRGGGAVVMVTNAPRPTDSVRRQLDRLKVPGEAYDAIVSSGDVTRGYIAEHRGQTACWIGPERDMPLFKGLEVAFAPLESADYLVCTGLFDDETETPDAYRARLEQAAARGVTMVCANPDIVVERGDRLVYCAGALAELYTTLGGRVIYGGKPHSPIYERAMAMAAKARGQAAPPARVLAIGDSVRTDLAGANAQGLRCLFVTGGIHAGDLGGRDAAPDAEALRAVFADTTPPFAITQHLRW